MSPDRQTRLPAFLASVVVLVLVGSALPAQDRTTADIDAFVSGEMHRQRIPGLALAIIRDGKPVLVKGYGLANVEHQVAVSPRTVFQSGSIGKQFTATAIMMLVEEGRLSLDDRISRFFVDAPDAWKDITVRHLLTHTAGLGDYSTDFDLRRDYSEDELYAHVRATPLNYTTGEGWDYSNYGFVLAGILIRKLTGKFYGDFLAERLFAPLGMTTARVISESDIIPNRAAGYRLLDGALANQEWVAPSINTTADGSLYLTIEDLIRWDAALSGGKVLRQASLATMWTPVKLKDGTSRPYGMGWHTDVIHGRRVVFHGGAWQGFKSFIVRLPDERVTITFFANLWEANEHRIARGLVAALFPEFALPRAQPLQDQEPQVTVLIRRTLRQLALGAPDSTLFTPEGARRISRQAREIGDALRSLSLLVALIGAIDLVGREVEGGLRVYRYAITDIGSAFVCTVTLANDDRIHDLHVRREGRR